MDLLEKETNAKQTSSKAKKIVLISLILCILILLLLLVMISALSGKQTTKQSFIVNGEEVTMPEEAIIKDETTGVRYISIEHGAQLVGYKYYNGEYGKIAEDKNKCYIQNDNEAIGFELDSKKIYKAKLKADVEYQNYNISNNIVLKNEKLYMTLEDFGKACNLIIESSEDGKQLKISSCEYYLTSRYSERLGEGKKYTELSDDYNNMKAVYYDMVVVKDGNKFGVTDKELENAIIGAKYDNIEFDEYTQSFIAGVNKKYGVFKKNGDIKIDFKYDEIAIMKYTPLLYKVKQDNKYGVIDEDGKIVISIEYNKIGYEDSSNKVNSLVIIENINNNENGIIVSKDGKYGIANLKTGELMLDCELDKIYSKTLENDEQVYYVEFKSNEFTLNEYIKHVNTTIVTLPQ